MQYCVKFVTVINLINVYCLKEKTRVILNGQ